MKGPEDFTLVIQDHDILIELSIYSLIFSFNIFEDFRELRICAILIETLCLGKTAVTTSAIFFRFIKIIEKMLINLPDKAF
jgi:hypothetical protein